MATTFTIPNAVFRLAILAIGVAIGYMAAWRGTPELDAIERRFFYRASYFLLVVSGWNYVWFELVGLFPIN